MNSTMTTVYRITPLVWLLLGAGLVFATVAVLDSVTEMVNRWETSEEYGYGYLIPLVSLFLIWQRKDSIETVPFKGAWTGVLILLCGALVSFVGQLGTIHAIAQYGYVLMLLGGLYAVLGWQVFRLVAVPVLLLFLMIPLPGFVYNNLSSQLQLISSQLGVVVIRLFDISVYLEGNVIDLGTYKLQVVEACSGLRYLFPLFSLAVIASCFYHADVWKKVVLIFSSIPITVLMNSFRIGVIGVLVEYGGIEQAEGFLHYFEGWVVFMASVLLLIAEMWLLSRVGADRRTFSEVFGMEMPRAADPSARVINRTTSPQLYLSLALLALSMLAGLGISHRAETVPERADFSSFPNVIGDWRGTSESLESIVLDALKVDDYYMADYSDPAGENVNLYIAYYGSQRSGVAAHSPRSCLPGGGWRIASRDRITLPGGVYANRFIISKGEYRQLVYYWFKQRDRIITDEFAVKWYLLVDAITRNRTDGALVRMTTLLREGEDPAAGDERMRRFAALLLPGLPDYLPD